MGLTMYVDVFPGTSNAAASYILNDLAGSTVVYGG